MLSNGQLQRILDREATLGEGYEIIMALVIDGTDVATLTSSEFTLLRDALGRLYHEFDKDLSICNKLTATVLKVEHGFEDPNRISWEGLIHDQLFLDYLKVTLNTDPIIEQVIVRMRKWLFLGRETSDLAPVVAAVAEQCFFNEYIYEIDAEEHALLTERCGHLSGDALEVVLLGMYRPPLSFLEEGVARRLAAASHPGSFDGAITRLVREPLEEIDLAASLPRRAIDDPTSRMVREQYEQNPYPRWYRLPWESGNPNTRKLPPDARILCAGCGTGRHVLGLARSFPKARIIGLDLSVASLAFGMRQARQLGLDRVEFVHGDLLEVEQLGEEFDLVECAGVLHCLGDDTRTAGWRALARVLVPEGLLRVYVYSAVARILIAKIRKEVVQLGLRPVPGDMRRYRSLLVERARKLDGYKQLTRVESFHSLSGLRDLLFHVQEHRYCIAELEQSAREAGLEFVSFHLPDQAPTFYRERFPDDPWQVSLSNWKRFETSYTGSLMMLDSTWCRAS